MTNIDISPEAVELKRRYKGSTDQLVNALRSMPIRGGITGQCIADEAATVIETLSAALAQSRAETAAALEAAAETYVKGDWDWFSDADEAIRALTPADSKAALDRMIADAVSESPEVRALVDALVEYKRRARNVPFNLAVSSDAAIAAIQKGGA